MSNARTKHFTNARRLTLSNTEDVSAAYDLLRTIRKARSLNWSDRCELREMILGRIKEFEKSQRTQLTVIQGGNPFCSRPSKATLSLVG